MKKIGIIYVVSIVPSRVMLRKLSKKIAFFANLGWLQQEILSLLKQFTYINPKGLVLHFQKMVLFIMLWLIVWEILGFEIEEFC